MLALETIRVGTGPKFGPTVGTSLNRPPVGPEWNRVLGPGRTQVHLELGRARSDSVFTREPVRPSVLALNGLDIVENETFCWCCDWKREEQRMKVLQSWYLFIKYKRERKLTKNKEKVSLISFCCLQELVLDRMMMITWKYARIYTWTDRPKNVLVPAGPSSEKQTKTIWKMMQLFEIKSEIDALYTTDGFLLSQFT